VLLGLPPAHCWQENWRDEDSVVNPAGILRTGSVGWEPQGRLKDEAGIKDWIQMGWETHLVGKQMGMFRRRADRAQE